MYYRVIKNYTDFESNFIYLPVSWRHPCCTIPENNEDQYVDSPGVIQKPAQIPDQRPGSISGHDVTAAVKVRGVPPVCVKPYSYNINDHFIYLYKLEMCFVFAECSQKYSLIK